MSERDSRGVVDEAVDAVTLNQDVEWERCARFATPAERRALDRLRRFTRLFAALQPTGRGSVTSPAPPAFASGFTLRAVRVLMALAAVELAFTLALLPWRWGDYFRAHGEVAVYMTLLFAGHGASAVLLLWAGRQDRRTWLLGGYFLFKTTVAPLHMLPAFWGQMPSVDMLQSSVWDTAGPTRAFPAPVCVSPCVRGRAGVPLGLRKRVPAGPSPDLAR